MPRVVAILEDDPARVGAMRDCLAEVLPRCEQQFFEHAGEMIAWLEGHLADVCLISLDHDLPIRRDLDGTLIDYGTGRQVVDYLCTRTVDCPVIVHSSNNIFSPGMVQCLKDAGIVHARVYPHLDTEWVRSAWVDRIKAYIRDGLIVVATEPSR